MPDNPYDIGPPSDDMATHLVLIVPETVTRGDTFAQVPAYTGTGTLYGAVIDHGGMMESDVVEVQQSSDSFSVMLFADADPAVDTGTVLRWMLMPPTGIPGTTPDDSAWQVEATADAKAQPNGGGCWFCTATAIT